MIQSADEFVTLRGSARPDEYLKAAMDGAELEVWLEVLHRFPHMKVWVARNKSVPIEILTILSSDSDGSVRAEVARKNKLPAHLMELLANDVDESVRHRIAYNKNVSSEILERLSADSSRMVATSAQAALALRRG